MSGYRQPRKYLFKLVTPIVDGHCITPIGFVPSQRVTPSREWRQTIGFISRLEWKSAGPDNETFAEQEQRLLTQRELRQRDDADEM